MKLKDLVPFERKVASSNGSGANPRKAGTSTSYSASGLIPPNPTSLDSEMGSSRIIPLAETVPELTSPYQRSLVYAKMMNDAGVDVSTRIWKTPILGAEFFVDSYSDDPADLEISQFIENNLFGGMSAPFVNSIEDILRFCEDGYAVLEKVYENRVWTPPRGGANGKTYTMLKKLAVRPPSTIKGIEYDNNGGPNGITQGAIQGDGTVVDKKLPIEQLIIFTLNRKGGDLTGKSLLRTAYPHWYYKTHLYKIDAIQKERHSLGVPVGKLLPGYTPEDKRIMRQLLMNLRANEESFALLTPNVEIEFAQVYGNLVDVLASATHHNMMILMNVMAQFMTLGVEGQGGGRATGATQADIFMKGLRYIAGYIADQLNMYLVPELVVWNYRTTNFPKVKVRNIGDTRDLQMFAAALANLFSQQALTGDPETENWIRKVFDMPAKQAAAVVTPANTTPTTTPQKGGTKQPRDKVGSPVGKSPTSAK